ncbi:MAG TPA: class I SAM-dependent methyltransferase [Actinomycetota bacterium]|jgi:trans-aconitate methyltransferase|nr:class I SAM-dependent methyltransferase [Actinomycetota bacterium]
MAPKSSYDELHRTREWAYGEQPDRQLEQALSGSGAGRAVDLGGGQGRHALFLAGLGFDVDLVDLSAEALWQASRAAGTRGLKLRTVRANVAFYEPPPGLDLVVAALLFHVPARHASLAAAERLGAAMNPGALLYLSLPGFDEATRALADELFAAAGCAGGQVLRHVVTPEERPRLPVARRNETRAIGFRA